MIQKNLCFSLALLISLAGMGCDPHSTMNKLAGGTYDGFILKKTDSGKSQTFVTAELKSPKDLDFQITVHERASDTPYEIEVVVSNQKTLLLSMPSALINRLELSSVKNNCFESHDLENWARFCYANGEASLDLKNKAAEFTLIIDPEQSSRAPINETPQAYTKNQLMIRAINRSFTSRLEYDKLVQAKLIAKTNVGNLFPHGSINTALTFLTPVLASYLKDVGELAPFLLPTRWLKMQESEFAYKAEFNGWLTAKADGANLVEGLALDVLQTEQTIAKLEANKVLITEIRDQIRARETTAILQIGSSDDITAVINDVDQTIENLNLNKLNQYATLAQASGFQNPHAITELVITKDDSAIDNPTPFDPAEITKIAIDRAYELRQLDFLFKAAQKHEAASKFMWMDPSGDPDGGLGLGFPSYIQIGESKERSILDQRDQLQSIIAQKLVLAFNQLDDAKKQRALALEGRDIQDRRITRLRNNIELRINYDLADLVTALQGRVKNDIVLTQTGFSYLIAWSNLNRLIYSGPYADLSRGEMLLPAFDAAISPPNTEVKP